MGHWGVKSYENDDAADAIDAGYERVHGDDFEALMDDRNPLTFDEVQQKLASPETLAAAIEALTKAAGRYRELDDWTETDRLAFAGVVVMHAEYGVPVADEWLNRAIAWIENESIEWDEATLRRLRREHEVAMLRKKLEFETEHRSQTKQIRRI